ncbi:hypothetical protein [Tenggerimyces flavus]|uniref:Uncharacterized protein n=1 Tax=Tenggerimyces flavus TaxID=1708749 RepID=A0ABV7YF77_9ACTN|nr:hypothetical protein [Tenggerimyces flavus]MBM7786791.1 hypothetical protein [Tenggerimyces flavus]
MRTTPGLRWWIETAVVAQLVGRPGNAVAQELRRQIEEVPLDALRAAIAYGVDEAVAVRSAAIKPEISAGAFAEHVVDALWDSLLHDEACQADERWIARPFRLTADLDTLLRQASESREAAARLEELQWSWAKQHSARRVHHIVLGQDEPSAIERVLDTRRDDQGWSQAIEKAGDHGQLDPVVAGILRNLPYAER